MLCITGVYLGGITYTLAFVWFCTWMWVIYMFALHVILCCDVEFSIVDVMVTQSRDDFEFPLGGKM